MLTMLPTIMIGPSRWDEDFLPRDEFEQRLEPLRAVMEARGLCAVIVYGDVRDHGALTYWSNFIPWIRWGLLVVPREGEPSLLVAMSPRDMPSMRQRTWLGNVGSDWQWHQTFEPWIEALGTESPGSIGTINLGIASPPLQARIDATLDGRFDLVALDTEAAAMRRAKRPRELAIMHETVEMLDTAVEAYAEAATSGSDVAGALLAAESAGRAAGAHDVRLLGSLDGGLTLAPMTGMIGEGVVAGLAYGAVKSRGYWAGGFFGAPPGRLAESCDAALDAALRAAGAGMPAESLRLRISGALGGARPHPVLGGTVGGPIGINPLDGEPLAGGATLTANQTYAIHAGAIEGGEGAVVSALVLVMDNGIVRLWSSPATPK